VVRDGSNDTSRTLDAGHVIDDLIDSHPSHRQLSVGLWTLSFLSLIATKSSNTPNLPLPINRGQHRG
jgi:hypothetical protein